MLRRVRTIITMILVAIICLAVMACGVLQQSRFGKTPDGERLTRLSASPNYGENGFRNRIPTSTLAEGQSTLKIILQGLFSHPERLRPEKPLPTMRLDLTNPDILDPAEDTIIWLGHSSYFIQLGGKRILVDPVFSSYGAPFSFLNKAFPGTNLYAPEDMPEIDYLLITHDHWDHLDYPTVSALRPKVGTVVCPLGVGAHFEHWGYAAEHIREGDWDTTLRFPDHLAITVVSARHYSGRAFTKNRTLWAGFVLESGERRLYLSGDTGYGPHFKAIAQTYGPFDLVALDGGQYDSRWPLIHMTPEQAVQAADDLGAQSMLLAHAGRFCISSHPWDEPFIRAAEAAKWQNVTLLTPAIGEPVWLNARNQMFFAWWEGVE